MCNDNIYEKGILNSSPVYPGYILTIGSTGSDVSIMQSYLNAIQKNILPSLNRLNVDGIFGNRTKTTVMQYQTLSCLNVDGIIGPVTWNSIVDDYNSIPVPPKDEYPGYVLKPGSSGEPVMNMQNKLNALTPLYSAINKQIADGKFGTNMSNATVRFQKQFDLSPDGYIGQLTWDKIVNLYNKYIINKNTEVSTNYPGYILNTGSQGDSVRFIQSYLNYINTNNNYGWKVLSVDGIYGSDTKQTVSNFQSKYGLNIDGIVGTSTWEKIINEFNKSI